MRIAFLNLAKNEDWGGGEKWTLVSACGLAEREHHVVVIGVEGSLIVKRAKNSGLEAFSIRVGIDYSPRGIFNVLRILKKSNIEILVVHHHKDVRIGGVSAKILGVPVVHRNGFPIISDNIRHRFTHRFVDRILTNSKRIADRYQTIDWINESEIDIVPNGIRIPDSTQKNNSLRKLWTDKNCLIAAYAGRLTSVKRPDDLLTAFSLLKPDSRWKLVIIGDGHLYEHLRNRINLDGLGKRIKLLGFRENAVELIAGSDLVVLPSSEEGMPNTIMEAMSCKIPVAASDVGDVSFLLDSGIAGWLFKVGETNFIKDLLEETEQNPSKLKEMGSKGFDRIKEVFSLDKMLDSIEKSLRTAIVGH